MNSSLLLPIQNPRNKPFLSVLSSPLGEGHLRTLPLGERGSSNAGVNFSENTINFFQSYMGRGGIYLFNHWGMGWSPSKCSLLPERHRRLFADLRRWNRTRCVVGGGGERARERRRRRREKKKKRLIGLCAGPSRGLRSSWVLFDNSCLCHWSVLDQMVVFPSGPHWHLAIPPQLKPNLRYTTNRRGARTIKHNKS